MYTAEGGGTKGSDFFKRRAKKGKKGAHRV